MDYSSGISDLVLEKSGYRSTNMDLREFYFQNIQENDYHYRFHESIENVNQMYNVFRGVEEVNNFEFIVYDTEEAITKFKELCQPEVSFSGSENRWWF